MSGERQQPAGRRRPARWLWGLAGGVVAAGVGGGLIGAAMASPDAGSPAGCSSRAWPRGALPSKRACSRAT